ncbi:carboxymuconolactone decarboxylase family protein [Caulobacter sp. LARHSG274]
MPRLTPIFRPGDYPGAPDLATRRALCAFFEDLYPGVAEPCIDDKHAGLAIAALNPALAGRLADMSGFVAGKLGWCARADLRELAIQTVNLKLGCAYAFAARTSVAQAAGLDAERQRALVTWRTSDLFSPHQRLVMEYAENVVASTVSDALFARLVEAFGEVGAMECTMLIAFWSFWALFLNATGAGDGQSGQAPP